MISGGRAVIPAQPICFDRDREGDGTKEWAPYSYNIGVGCSHNCRYCYARHNAVSRFHTVKSVADWEREKIRYGIRKIPAVKKNDVIMTPTTHDITPFYLSEFIIGARGLLEAGNALLVVSKPHLDCVQQVCAHLDRWRQQIMFRFTIGTTDERVAHFWEPGAPAIAERLACLKYAYDHGWRTSVSAEPLLGGYDNALYVVAACEPFVTDTIWFGRMNLIRQRVDHRDRDVLVRIQEIERLQRDSEMLRLYYSLRDNPRVRWKASISRLVEKLEGRQKSQTGGEHSES
jgi:DNA repair photolyase